MNGSFVRAQRLMRETSDETSGPRLNSLCRRLRVKASATMATTVLADLADRHEPIRPAFQLHVKAPVRLPNLAVDIELCHPVDVQLFHDPAAMPSIAIRWLPARGDDFPHFTGRIWTEPESERTCWLCLDGSYEHLSSASMRLTASGERVVGHRIALATAKKILEELAGYCEAARARG